MEWNGIASGSVANGIASGSVANGIWNMEYGMNKNNIQLTLCILFPTPFVRIPRPRPRRPRCHTECCCRRIGLDAPSKCR